MLFITLEGGEGAGKTTQMMNMAEMFFEPKKLPWVITREPGGTEIGKQIRQILKSTNNTVLAPEAELFLFLADRTQHIKQIITPALNRGDIVICDRYLDSTFAYQGVARNLKVDLAGLHQLFDVPIPDITFLLDLPIGLGLSRAWHQIINGKRDYTQARFENEKFSFHENLRRGYLRLAKQEPHRFCVIDAKQSEEKVWRDIQKILNTFF